MGSKQKTTGRKPLAVSRQRPTPIGVFDSGTGAYLVGEEIRKKISGKKIIIKTDPRYFPYGNKSPQQIQDRLTYFVKEFQKEGCQVVVIACNSATTNGIVSLRRKFPELLFVGIEPPVKPIVGLTKTGKVAVIGTTATMRSMQLKRLIERYGDGVTIHAIACPGLAELVEERVRGSEGLEGSDLSGRSDPSMLIRTDQKERTKDEVKYCKIFYKMNFNSHQNSDFSGKSYSSRYIFKSFKRFKYLRTAEALLTRYLDRPISEGVDVVGIACTHYSYLVPLMEKLYPGVSFYDPTEAVVRRLRSLLSSVTAVASR